MRRFVDLRRSGGRPKAWQQWMEDAALAAPFLCPTIIQYDNLMKLIMEVDVTILKNTSDQVRSTPESALRGFLSTNTIDGESVKIA